MMRPARSSEDGAALITVLMIVAAMSAVALALSQSIFAATSRAKALDAQAQADWYVVAAEEFALAQMSDVLSEVEGRLFEGAPGLGEPMRFTLDGGLLTITVRDATNCFNLNALGAPSSDEPDEAGTVDPHLLLAQMLNAAGFGGSEIESMSGALTDWMDRNTTPVLSGAEDGYYTGLNPPYRTPGSKLAGESELRAIRHFFPDRIERISRLTCVRPTSQLSPLNLNTLTEAQAPLLAMAMSGVLDVNAAERLIATRPALGWAEMEDFLSEPPILAIDPTQRRAPMIGLVSSHLEVTAEVDYRGQTSRMRFVFSAEPGAPVRTLYRERIG